MRGGYSAKPVAKTDDAHVQRDRVIAHVNERRIVKTTARSEYKVTEAELKSLKHVVTRGMMGRQSLLYVRVARSSRFADFCPARLRRRGSGAACSCV